MSSSDIKLPPMPTPALDGQMYTGQQLDTYARRTVELNKPDACLYYRDAVLARGSWDEMRNLQGLLLSKGERTAIHNSRLTTARLTVDSGNPVFSVPKSAAPTAAEALRLVESVLGSDQGAEMVGFEWKLPETGVLDVPADTKMLRMERKGHEPLEVSRADVLAVAFGKKQEPEPFDLERAKAGEPIRTRGGLAARFVGFDKDMPQDRQVVVVVAPSILYSHRFADGRFTSAPGPHSYDLVMAPKPKRVVWVNTFKKPGSHGVTQVVCDTEEHALEHSRCFPPGRFSTVAERKEI